MSLNTPVIVDAIRSPMGRGKADGSLAQVHACELLAQVLEQLVSRNKLDPGRVDDVITGCVSQVGEQSGTPGRMAWLAAGFPAHVPSTTIDRKCGSSQQAVHFAAQAILSGMQDIVIAAGVESMSRIPMGSAKIGQNSVPPRLDAQYAGGLVGQGVAADLVATKWGISREDVDRYAMASHLRAAKVQAEGGFKREIVGIHTPNGLVDTDETIRANTTMERLAGLKSPFQTPELAARFPDLSWSTTAGNASQITDGASAMLIMSEGTALKLGLRPRARFVAFDVVGDDPLYMLTAPIAASQRALVKAGLKVDDIDHFEINEAFASVPLAWQRELGADMAKLNPRGGAIALGHPLGASGIRLMTTMLHALEDSGQRYGLQSMCEAGGMANGTIIERL